jgi:elongation factor P
LLTGNVIDKTFKSGESVETADINHREMDFLYSDGEIWNFMDPDNFDQLEVDSKLMGDAKKWLVGQERCEIVLWNDQPISVEAPVFVNLVIKNSEPGVKGDTVSGATKVAELETGVNIHVPLFVNEGETIKVDTRSESYVSRV